MTDLEKKLEQLCVGQGLILFPTPGGWEAIRLSLESPEEILSLAAFNPFQRRIEVGVSQAETLGALVEFRQLEQLCVGQGVILFPKQRGWVALSLTLEGSHEFRLMMFCNPIDREIRFSCPQAETLGALAELLT